MDTITIIAIIIGIITVITVVVVIVIQNKKTTPSTPTTGCEWVEGKWEIDNNTQMNLQDNNYPDECSHVTGNCGNSTRDVTCAPSNGVGNCTDNECTGTKPVDNIQCRPCPNHPRQLKMNFFLDEQGNIYDLSSECTKIKCTQKGHEGNQISNMRKELVDKVVTFSNRNGGGFDVKTLKGDNFFFQQTKSPKPLPTVLGYNGNVWGVNEDTDLFIRLYSDETYKNEITSTRDIDTLYNYWFVFEDKKGTKYYPYLNIDDFNCRMVILKKGTIKDDRASEKNVTIQLNDHTE